MIRDISKNGKMPPTRAECLVRLIQQLEAMADVQSDAAFVHTREGRKEAAMRCDTRRECYDKIIGELIIDVGMLPNGNELLESTP